MEESEIREFYKKRQAMEKEARKVFYKNIFKLGSFWLWAIMLIIIVFAIVYTGLGAIKTIHSLNATIENNQTFNQKLITNQTFLAQTVASIDDISLIESVISAFIFVVLLCFYIMQWNKIRLSKKEWLSLDIKLAARLKEKGYSDKDIRKFILDD